MGRVAPGAVVMLLGIGLLWWALLGLGVLQPKVAAPA